MRSPFGIFRQVALPCFALALLTACTLPTAFPLPVPGGGENEADGFDPRLPGTHWALDDNSRTVIFDHSVNPHDYNDSRVTVIEDPGDSATTQLHFLDDNRLLIVENGDPIAASYEFGEWAGGRLKVTVDDSWPWLGPHYLGISHPGKSSAVVPGDYEYVSSLSSDTISYYHQPIRPATYPLDYSIDSSGGYAPRLHISDAGGIVSRTYFKMTGSSDD